MWGDSSWEAGCFFFFVVNFALVRAVPPSPPLRLTFLRIFPPPPSSRRAAPVSPRALEPSDASAPPGGSSHNCGPRCLPAGARLCCGVSRAPPISAAVPLPAAVSSLLAPAASHRAGLVSVLLGLARLRLGSFPCSPSPLPGTRCSLFPAGTPRRAMSACKEGEFSSAQPPCAPVTRAPLPPLSF